MIEGGESFQDAANSVMEAAGAIAGQHSDKYLYMTTMGASANDSDNSI